jgi:hypothetical protein
VQQLGLSNRENRPFVAPNETAPLSNPARLSVYSGRTRCGHLIERGGPFEAFGVNGRSLGSFATMTAAARAVSPSPRPATEDLPSGK